MRKETTCTDVPTHNLNWNLGPILFWIVYTFKQYKQYTYLIYEPFYPCVDMMLFLGQIKSVYYWTKNYHLWFVVYSRYGI